MIEIEINGKTIKAEVGERLISVTDREGISVPRFCYHKKLSVAASCRMCLVDVEGAPKPQPACSTPVTEGMKIHTNNDKAKQSQQAVMDFLLINHPLDCPICDQGGECELQDVAVGYGADISSFNEGKRTTVDKDISPLIQTDMTRCIHCTRCVRFGAEIAGVIEMGGTGRGDNLKIEPFLENGISSELSGNMIDVCPVGALTSKPFRFELRSWQMFAHKTIARHDLVGSNIIAQTYKNKVKRVVAADNDDVNETWISDRDRFSYEGLKDKNRLLKPQIKIAGQWQEAKWDVALDFAIKGIKSSILNNHQINKLGALAGSTATLEEYYLLQKILRQIGTQNIDYRLNIKDLDNALDFDSNIKLADLEKVDYALIVSSNVRLEQPMLNHRLRKAALNGAQIDAINVKQFDFNYKLNSENIISPNKITLFFAGVLKSILKTNNKETPQYLDNVKISKNMAKIADELSKTKNGVVILGEHIINNKNAKSIANLLKQIAKNTNNSTLNLSATGNAKAADLANFKPSKDGLNANEMLGTDLKSYILLDVYPDYDFHNYQNAIKALNKDDAFVIAFNSFQNDDINNCADVMLPIASFYETSGTFVNINNDLLSFGASVSAPKDVKPAWKILKVLADLLELPGFDYVSSTDVLSEIVIKNHQNSVDEDIDLNQNNDVDIIWQKSPYTIDVLLRHSKALQKTKIGKLNYAFMNVATQKKLKLKDKDKCLGVPTIISEKVADDCVFINANKHTGGQKLWSYG